MDFRINKRGKIIVAVLIALTLIFIFSQSVLSGEQSQQESDKIGQIIEAILPDNTPIEEFFDNFLRKIAHFFEFAVLGAEVFFYILLSKKKEAAAYSSFPFSPLFALASVNFGAAVAFVDESIQVFSKRGPEITDMWIDILGYLSATAILYLAFCIVMFAKNAKNNKKSIDKTEELR